MIVSQAVSRPSVTSIPQAWPDRITSLNNHRLSLAPFVNTKSPNCQQPNALLAALPDLIFQVDEAGVYQDFLPAKPLVRFAPPAAYLGRSISETMPAALAQQMMDCIRQALQQDEPQLLEFQLQRPEGVAVYEARFLTRGNQGVFTVIRDITSRWATEDQLRKLSRVVEQSPNMIIITDAEGAIEYVNPRFTQITGYGPAEVIGGNPRCLKSNNTPAETFLELWATITSGQEWRGELRNRKKNGDLYWVHASISPIIGDNGVITHFLAAEEDITERKEMESTLLQRNRELILLNRASQALSSTLDFDQVLEIMLEEVRRLLNVVACSVWLIDRETNQLVCRQVTDPLGEIVRGWRLEPGQGLAGWVATRGESIIVPDAWSDERHFKGIDAQTGLPLRSILTVPLRTKQDVIGVLQVVDQTINRFGDNDLRLMESLAGVAANAIENAHLFTELTKTQAQLIQRERLAALGQMSATIAHELRNPLMAIRMGVEYLLRNVAEDDPRQRGAQLMHANIDRIDRIVEDILFVARAPQPKLIPALLPPIIEAEVARWELTLAEKKISLHLDLDASAPSIMLDIHQMARALSNLIGNSVDILSPGGEIRLQLYSREEDQVTISLADNGPGISPEHLPRVFDPFFTTKTRGTGLGLSIVKQIVEYHQGVIEVWSDMSVGTRFTILLPTIEGDRIRVAS
jgi:PAS domain S-box-containing protein